MIPQLTDPRRQEDVVHDLASLIRTSVLLAAQGWRDHDDADALRDDPAFRLAVSSVSGRTPLDGPHGLASQPTLSRFTAIMAEPSNRSVLREAALELGARGARAERGGKRPGRLTLDVDSLPIDVHGHQAKAECNGHDAARIYHPLVTSVASRRWRACGTTTGDMLNARRRAGNVGTADGTLDVILDVIDRANAQPVRTPRRVRRREPRLPASTGYARTSMSSLAFKPHGEVVRPDRAPKSSCLRAAGKCCRFICAFMYFLAETRGRPRRVRFMGLLQAANRWGKKSTERGFP